MSDLTIIGTSAAVIYHPAEDHEFDGFLAKPVDYNHLVELLSSYLAVEWIYDPGQKNSCGQPSTAQTTLLSSLTPPPAEELNELYDLAMKGNMPGIYRRAAELEKNDARYQAFIQQLTLLAKAYEEDQVLAFLEPYINGRATNQQTVP